MTSLGVDKLIAVRASSVNLKCAKLVRRKGRTKAEVEAELRIIIAAGQQTNF